MFNVCISAEAIRQRYFFLKLICMNKKILAPFYFSLSAGSFM